MKKFNYYTPLVLAVIAAVFFVIGMLIQEVSLAFAIISLALSMLTYIVSKKQAKNDSLIFGIGLIASCIIWIVSAVYLVALILVQSAVTSILYSIL